MKIKKVILPKVFILILLLLLSQIGTKNAYSTPEVIVTEYAIATYSGLQNFGKADAEDVIWDGNGPDGVGVYVYNFSTQTTTTLSDIGTEYNSTMSNGLVAWRSSNSSTDCLQMFRCPKTGNEEPDSVYDSVTKDGKLCTTIKADKNESLERVYFVEKTSIQGVTVNLLKVWDSISDTVNIISDANSEKVGITLYNSYVFWSDNRSGNYDIWAYDFISNFSFPLVSASGDQILPGCHGSDSSIGSNFIVWQDSRNCTVQNPDNYDVYGKNLQTGQVFIVADSTKKEIEPVASGNKVAWIEKDIMVDQNAIQTGWQDTIKIKDMATNIVSTISTSPTFKEYLCMNGDFVIWSETSHLNLINSAWNLTGYSTELMSIFPVSNFSGDQFACSLNGNKIFWTDSRSDQGDLYYATLVVQQ